MPHPDLAIHPALWQACRPASGLRPVLPTGHAALDAALADGGWPRGALSELLLPATGVGELPLLLPALTAHADGGGWLLLVNPPHRLYLPAWQAAGMDSARLVTLHPDGAEPLWWSAEQAARVPGCAVLVWAGDHAPATRVLRRLQLAARDGDAFCALLRPAAAHRQASPAALRLQLAAGERGHTRVTVLKQRGGFGGTSVTLPLHAARALPRLAPWQLPVHGPDTRTTVPAPPPREQAAVGDDAGAPAVASAWPGSPS
ncbi:MAG: translesion DNA synthesis-associated protein ImuA [Gammaproteobacteria bacterium]